MAKKRRSKKLPRAAVALLGKLSDEEIAERFDVPIRLVFAQRCELELGSARGLEWNPEQVALLGTASDEDVAAELGVTRNSVFQRRKKREIPAYGLSTDEQRHRWTKRQLAWLGKLTDKEIATRIGVAASAVSEKRRIAGIDAIGPARRPLRKWTKAEVKLLGRFPDRVVAERTGTHRHQIAVQRRQRGIPSFAQRTLDELWTPERLAKLQRVPGAELAEEMGISVAAVNQRRLKEKRRGRAPNTGVSAKRAAWTAEQVDRLGTVPDRVIAEELGVTRAAVQLVRKRLGIDAFMKRGE